MITRRGWATFVLLGVGCSTPPSFIGPAAPDGGAAADAPDVTTACTDLATAECTELERCSTVILQTRYGSTSTCQTRLASSCMTALAAPSTGNSAHLAEACAQAYPTWSCPDYLGNVNLPPACAQPTGALAKGSSCAFAAQCSTGFCAISPSTACGTCANPPAPGDSCADLSSCGQRLVCLPGSRVCGTFGALGSSCSREAPCGAHLSCIGASTTRGILGTCQSSQTLTGAVCDPTLIHGPGCDYDGNLTCNGESKQCEPLVISTTAGPCDSNDGQFATCAASGSCSTSEAGATGTCRAAALDGQPCTTTRAPGCVPPARCITAPGETSGTCQPDNATSCK